MTDLLRSDGTNPVRGDSLTVERTVTDIPDGESLTDAWLTVKSSLSDADADAVMQLTIDVTAGDDGQITDSGSGDPRTGTLVFTVTPDHFTAVLKGNREYLYDIQVLTDEGTVGTPFLGTVVWQADVTKSNA